jgi:hypothetical protein
VLDASIPRIEIYTETRLALVLGSMLSGDIAVLPESARAQLALSYIELLESDD